MGYEYVAWEIVPGLIVPMMEDGNGNLWGTNKTIANMLNLTEEGVRYVYNTHKAEFDGLSVANCDAKAFLKLNKEVLGVKYIRGDMRLWSAQDMLTFCYKATGPTAVDIRKRLTQFIIENSRKAYVSEDLYKEMENQLEAAKTINKDLVDFIMATIPGMSDIASLAGKTLAAHKKTKEFREKFLH